MTELVCTRCYRPSTRNGLTVKKVSYQEVGDTSTALKTRTADWLCIDCLRHDREWNLPANVSTKERMDDARSRRETKALPR